MAVEEQNLEEEVFVEEEQGSEEEKAPEKEQLFLEEERESEGNSVEREKNYEAILEAILFAMGESVELEKLAGAVGLTPEETRRHMEHMRERYGQSDRGMTIMELEGAWQMCTKSEMYEYLIKIAKQPKKNMLTDVLLETLSIIAYKQPVTKAEIEKIRGVSSDHAVNKLVEYKLVTELGRLDVPGRPLLFGTTEEFLRSFGVQSVEELPTVDPVRMEEFKQEAEAEMQIKLGI